MRAFSLRVASVVALALTFAAVAGAAAAAQTPEQALSTALAKNMTKLGVYSGAYVKDLTTGQSLYSYDANTGRMPASVEKLYTTTTALLKFGPTATLTTSLYGTGSRSRSGTWTGNLYLRGGGDPTFGTASFDRLNYSGGATVQRLVLNLEHRAHLKALKG